jgi:hypothetical protein
MCMQEALVIIGEKEEMMISRSPPARKLDDRKAKKLAEEEYLEHSLCL